MSIVTFDDFVAEIDVLCHKRAASYPVRDESHAALSRRLVVLCHWLIEQRNPNWQPDPDMCQQAEEMTPLFIGGFHKSGTTFLLNLLDSHPAISALPGDAGLFQTANRALPLAPSARYAHIHERWIHGLVNPTGLPPFWLFGQVPEPYETFLNYLDWWLTARSDDRQGLMQAVAFAYFCANPRRQPSPRYWVDKYPTLERCWEDLSMLFPTVRFAHVVRNPLAILAAMKTFAHARGERFRLAHMIEELKSSLRAGLTYQNMAQAGSYRIVRYEDMVASPALVMQELAQWLSIPYRDTLLIPTINGLASTPNSAYKANRVQGQIQTQSLEKWRQHLTQPEVEWIVDSLFPEAQALGYDWSGLLPAKVRRAQARVTRFASGKIIDPLWRFVIRIGQAIQKRLPQPDKPFHG